MFKSLTLETVLNWIINALFLFYGDKLKGARTVILAVGTAIIAGWQWISGSGIFDVLCSLAQTIKLMAVFCTVTEGKFWAVVVVIMASIELILRKLTDTPIGVRAVTTNGRPIEQTSESTNWILAAGSAVFFMAMVFVVLPWVFLNIFG